MTSQPQTPAKPPPLRILISGAGIAGPCLTYWLLRTPLIHTHTLSITLLERSPIPRTTGQSIDIRGPAINIIRRMGLESSIRALHTTEEGTRLVNGKGGVIAEFGKGRTFTHDYEILRADLCRLFLEKTQGVGIEGVEYVYGDYVTSLTQDDDDPRSRVEVTFHSGKTETYDLVVGADGSTSKIRSMILNKSLIDNGYNFIGQYVAFFSIPSNASDNKYWNWYNAPKGLGLMTRPHRTPETIGCYICVTMPGHGIRDERIEKAMDGGVESQKRVLTEMCTGMGWQAERILEGMQTAEDFYMSRAAQVKLPKWHDGRVVLLGDAAHATFGIGTSLAIQGAYRLAGELGKIKSTEDIPQALATYEREFREVYRKDEDLPPGFPQIGFPQSAWVLWLRDSLLWFVSKTQIYKLLPDDTKESTDVPEYQWIGRPEKPSPAAVVEG